LERYNNEEYNYSVEMYFDPLIGELVKIVSNLRRYRESEQEWADERREYRLKGWPEDYE
jgi:hypothetical protein